jgi:hypothetical protein
MPTKEQISRWNKNTHKNQKEKGVVQELPKPNQS